MNWESDFFEAAWRPFRVTCNAFLPIYFELILRFLLGIRDGPFAHPGRQAHERFPSMHKNRQKSPTHMRKQRARVGLVGAYL